MDHIESNEQLNLVIDTTVVSDTGKIASLLEIAAAQLRSGALEGSHEIQGGVVMAWAITADGCDDEGPEYPCGCGETFAANWERTQHWENTNGMCQSTQEGEHA